MHTTPMYTSGSSNNPSPGNSLPNQIHLQQNHASSYSEVQPACMYPPPPPASSQQYHHSHLPPVSMLPPPPPLPPGATPPSQAYPNPFHAPPSFPLSFPLKSLEPPGMPLPPPPPSSSPLFADTACAKPESANGRALDIEDAASSSPHNKAADGSPLYDDDPDIEMEDDITLPESSQPLNYGSDQLHIIAFSNTTQQQPPQPETNSVTVPAINFETNLPVANQDVDDGSRQASSSPYSGRTKVVPLGDMYDPFVDSFEPASVKLDCVQEHEPVSESYTVVPKASVSSNRQSMEENNQSAADKQALSEFDTAAQVSVSSNKPPDVEENTTGNDVGAVVSGDNDNEFGENAESGREGNSHETLTPNSNNENPKANNNNVLEADSTRRKSRGDAKEKDSSSSRSMKLFQVALTKFVKELLKPSWRQGNMSKEAFKTIVKRAVDKVSNSMEGRRVPKSKAKIDKYIDSSRDKLTKLVMGYVDKYVKA